MASETRKLTLADIRFWALENGFSETAPSVLSAPYATAAVRIELLKRNLRVAIVGEGREHVLISAPPANMHIDEHGMLQGAGLFTWFYTLYRDAERDNPGSGVLPVWFSQYHKEVSAEHAAEERESRDMGSQA